MIVEKIQAYLNGGDKTVTEHILGEVSNLSSYAFKRQFMESKEFDGRLRLSTCGKCPRALAYAYHGFEKAGKKLDARAFVVFWMGDMVEFMITSLAQCAGVEIKNVGLNQLEVCTEINGVKILGHPDGVVKDHLFECKSMSSFAYRKFDKGEVDEGYLSQINMYMDELKLDKCVLVAVAKDSGTIGELIIHKNETLVKQIKADLTTVIDSSNDNLPAKKFVSDSKGFYPWNCLYCGYWQTCHPKAKQVLVKSKYKLMKQRGQNET